MLSAVRNFLRTVSGSDNDRSDAASRDTRIAAAALLYHVIDADGVVTEAEKQRLASVLSEEYGLDTAETDRIIAAGQKADAEAVDLFHFTSILKNRLSEAERIRFIELLWEVTYADGAVHELEDNLIWRVSDLLGVSTRDRMLMKREAAERGGPTD